MTASVIYDTIVPDRLGVDKQAHDVCEISILEDTKKKRARIPEHFSVGICIDYLFTHCCDIRAVPTKVKPGLLTLRTT